MRGDLLTVELQGDLGKPRPVLVIQSDLFADHPSVTVLPVTGSLQPAPLFRIGIEPNEADHCSRLGNDSCWCSVPALPNTVQARGCVGQGLH